MGGLIVIYRQLKSNESVTIFDSPYNHVIHAFDVFGIIDKFSNSNDYDCGCYNMCTKGVSNSLDVVNQMVEFLGSLSNIEIITSGCKINHIISNIKLLNFYQPFNVFETINLYLEEMKQLEEL